MSKNTKLNLRKNGVWQLSLDYLDYIREGGEMSPTEWNEEAKKNVIEVTQ